MHSIEHVPEAVTRITLRSPLPEEKSLAHVLSRGQTLGGGGRDKLSYRQTSTPLAASGSSGTSIPKKLPARSILVGSSSRSRIAPSAAHACNPDSHLARLGGSLNVDSLVRNMMLHIRKGRGGYHIRAQLLMHCFCQAGSPNHRRPAAHDYHLPATASCKTIYRCG